MISERTIKIQKSCNLFKNWGFELSLRCKHGNDFKSHLMRITLWPSAFHFILNKFLIIFKWNPVKFNKLCFPSSFMKGLKGSIQILFEFHIRGMLQIQKVAGVILIICIIYPSHQMCSRLFAIMLKILKYEMLAFWLLNLLLCNLHRIGFWLFLYTYCSHFFESNSK